MCQELFFAEGNGLQGWHHNSCKIHKKDRPDSQGDIHTFNESKITVFGSILPTVHVRDTEVTNGVNSTGEGLGIHESSYYINDQLKYHIAFDEIQNDYKNKWATFFNKKFNTSTGTSVLYGNHDYIKLFRLQSDQYCAPHKVIDDGIWKTRGMKGSSLLLSDIPSGVQYPDNKYDVDFSVLDAAGNRDDASNLIFIDNFKPYITWINVKANNSQLYQIERVGNEGGAANNDGSVINNIQKYPINNAPIGSSILSVEIRTSEPMTNLRFSHKKESQPVFSQPVNMIQDAVDKLKWRGNITTTSIQDECFNVKFFGLDQSTNQILNIYGSSNKNDPSQSVIIPTRKGSGSQDWVI